MYTFEGTVLGILKSERVFSDGTVKRTKKLALKSRDYDDSGYRDVIEQFALPKDPSEQKQFNDYQIGEVVNVCFSDKSFRDNNGRLVQYRVLIPDDLVANQVDG